MDPLRDQLQQALGQTYRIDRELGGGGMSRVFLSTETALDRRVVLKVLPPELASGVSIERFKREISLAAKLQHAHIVPLLSTGDANGLPWFAMPFVDGASLRTRLGAGELPIADVVHTLRDVASALAYAHGKGVVHRDIKPENILLAEGGAAVTDFGVAKALVDAGAEHGSTLTSVGVALGTPAYMAPEQIAGDGRTDHRADIYALGVVAYEMLCGHDPFAGRSPQATMAAHMTEDATPVERLRPATPPALAQLVLRCMAKSAADRVQSAQEIVNALDGLSTPSGTMPMGAASRVAYPAASTPSMRRTARMAAIALGVAVVAVGAWYATQRSGGGAPVTNLRRVAVVPFENLTGDKALDVVGRVASEELSRSIAQTDSADVVDGNVVLMALGDAAQSSESMVARVAKATGAGIVVRGSYSKAGDSLRMQVSVIDAKTGKVLRALDPTTGTVSDPMVAIAALRERLLGSIVSGDLARKVTIGSAPPKYSAYLEHLAGLAMAAKSQTASRAFFERAIALDSTFVTPYIALANTHAITGSYADADAVIVRLRAQRDRLSSVDRLAIDYFDEFLVGNLTESLKSSQELYRRTGDLFWAALAPYSALAILRPAEALDALRASDSFAIKVGWIGQIDGEAIAHHLLADYRKELESLDRGIALLPQFTAQYTATKFRAYAGLHDFAAARTLADTLLALRSDRGSIDGLNTVASAAWEFDAHGDSAGGQLLTQQALDWARSNALPKPSILWERSVGSLWLFAGELDSAAAHFARALPDTSIYGIGTAAYLAMIAARRNDVARARAVSDSMAANVPKWDRGRTPYWRAAILAELGDRAEAVRVLTVAPSQGARMDFWHRNLALRSLRGYAPYEALITPKK